MKRDPVDALNDVVAFIIMIGGAIALTVFLVTGCTHINLNTCIPVANASPNPGEDARAKGRVTVNANCKVGEF